MLQSGFKVAIPHSHHPTGRTILLELGLCGWVLYHSSSPTCVPFKNQINKIYDRKPFYKYRGHTEQHVTNHFFTMSKITVEELLATRPKLPFPRAVFIGSCNPQNSSFVVVLVVGRSAWSGDFTL